jgi:dTDP-4-dehydrorhamnose reductase
MKILVLGSGGRLGAALVREWRAAGDEVSGFNHAQLDIGDFEAVRKAVLAEDFNVLVNCAAQTNVDFCETHPEEAHRLNAGAVGAIASACLEKQARCIQISTDYVFDGAKSEPYTEEDAALPISVYGASKLSGEQALLEVSGEFLAVRVSWVFGPDRPSFVDQILQRALEQETVAAIADKVAVPTYTLDAALLLHPLLEDGSASGVLHLCNHGACTWQEYGQLALDAALEAGVPLRARHVSPQKMAELKAFIAKRPPQSAMSTARLTKVTGRTPRPWQEAVAEYVREKWAPSVRR